MNALLASLRSSTAIPARWTKRTRRGSRSCTRPTACLWTRTCPPGSTTWRRLPGTTAPACTRWTSAMRPPRSRPSMPGWTGTPAAGSRKPRGVRSAKHVQPAQRPVLRRGLAVALRPERHLGPALHDGRRRGNRASRHVQRAADDVRGRRRLAGVDLPYAEGFVMRLVLPDARRSGRQPQQLRREQLTEIAAALDAAPLADSADPLPKWDHKSSFDLRKVFEAAGPAEDPDHHRGLRRHPAEADDHAGRPGRQHHRRRKGHRCRRRDPDQRRRRPARRPSRTTIDFDRPFHYQIVHIETGLPLFMGTVADPRSYRTLSGQVLQRKPGGRSPSSPAPALSHVKCLRAAAFSLAENVRERRGIGPRNVRERPGG